MAKGKRISKKKAIDEVKRFKDNHSKSTHSVLFDASLVQDLLDIPGCVSVRIHFAETDEKVTTLVLVAVDKDNNAILPATEALSTEALSKDAAQAAFILNDGQRCPPFDCPKSDL